MPDAPSEYFCGLCRQVVRRNYDHVGDCELGACSGTFEHSINPGAAACPKRNRDLTHAEVTAA